MPLYMYMSRHLSAKYGARVKIYKNLWGRVNAFEWTVDGPSSKNGFYYEIILMVSIWCQLAREGDLGLASLLL